jgi:dienelactone hydrolase
MAHLVLFHSVLGLRTSVLDTAELLRNEGHTVHTPDLYEGKTFDDYQEASAFVEAVGGRHELMSRTAAAVAEIHEPLVYAGFSNGGASAEYLACTRRGARAAVLFHAALPLVAFGVQSWPGSVPVQVHYAEKDPFREQVSIDALASAVQASGARYEFCEYPATGHLFSDSGLPEEFDQASAQVMLSRTVAFLAALPAI